MTIIDARAYKEAALPLNKLFNHQVISQKSKNKNKISTKEKAPTQTNEWGLLGIGS